MQTDLHELDGTLRRYCMVTIESEANGLADELVEIEGDSPDNTNINGAVEWCLYRHSSVFGDVAESSEF